MSSFWQRSPLWGQFSGNLHVFTHQSFGQFGRLTSYFVVSKTTTAQKTESSLFPPPKFKFFSQVISHPIMSRAQTYSIAYLCTVMQKGLLTKGFTFCRKTQNILIPAKFQVHLALFRVRKLPRAQIDFIAYLSNFMQKGLFKNKVLHFTERLIYNDICMYSSQIFSLATGRSLYQYEQSDQKTHGRSVEESSKLYAK